MIRRLVPVLVLAATTLLVFWKVIFHSEFTLVIGEDTASAYYPWFEIAAHWLKRGTFLLWDPYVLSGKPFMAEPQPGLFYPLNWLFLLLPSQGRSFSPDGLQALMILDYFLAACFFYLLARAFQQSRHGSAAAAIVFAFSGYTVELYGYINKLSGFVWMPLAVLCFEKARNAADWKLILRWALLGGVCLALTFLPGHHIPTVHTGLFLGLYAAFVTVREWRSAGWTRRLSPAAIFSITALTSALLTVFQWLPSAEWARVTYRWVGAPMPVQWHEQVPYSALQGAGNLSPQDALSLLLPYVTTGANLYVGPAALFLALLALFFVRRAEARFLGFAGCLYFVLSWGKLSAVHGWVNTFVPGAWFAREVFHYTVPFQMCLALLAGYGLDHLVQRLAEPGEAALRSFVRRTGWVIALIVIGAGASTAYMYLHRDLPMHHPYITSVAGLSVYLFLLGYLLFQLRQGWLRPGSFRVWIIVLMVVDVTSRLSASIQPKVPADPGSRTTYVRSYWKKSDAAEHLIALRGREFFRVDDPMNVFPPNFGDVWRIEATMGHGATALVDYFQFRGMGWGPTSNATSLLNAVYFPSSRPIDGLEKVWQGSTAIYRNPRAVPRAYGASSYRAFGDDRELLEWVRGPMFSLRDTVLLRESDLGSLDPQFLGGLRNDRDSLQVRLQSLRTAAEKTAAAIQDPGERHLTAIMAPPWGWSAGDEAEISLRADSPKPACFVVIRYVQVEPAPSRIALSLTGPAGIKTLVAELPDMGAPDLPARAVVNLGPLDAGDYVLEVSRPDDCTANIDSVAVYENEPADLPKAGDVAIKSWRPNRLRLETNFARPALLVLSEVHYPGWDAWVDGKRVPILRGNYILRALPVPEGAHQVELRYRPRLFYIGLAVSLAFLAVMIFWVRRLR